MKFEKREIALRNGKTCVLCPTSSDYAEEMIEYLKLTSEETPYLLRYPDEVQYTVESEKEILDRLVEEPRTVMMMGLVDGVVAGNCSINGIGYARRIRHRCSMAIALKKEFWGLGIGSAMIQYLTELAVKMGYEQIELEVVEGNEQAKKIYEKCGFIETGKHPNAMKYDDGTYLDETLMVKKL